MRFGSSKSLFLRFSEPPPRTYRAISILVANFSSCNVITGSSSGQFTSRQQQEESRGVKVSVWWDFENCTLSADDANVFKVAQTITTAVRINGIKGPITISAFGDVLQLSRTNQEALFATGISLTHVPQGADRSLITDLMYWVTQNPPPAHLFLISSNRDFASVLHKLRMNNYNILLAGNEETTPGVLCSAASIMWDWNALVKGGNFTGKYFNQPPDGPYNSWYGHYKTPLLDPFDISSSTMTKQQPCASVKTEDSNSSLNSGKVCCSIPKEVVKQIGLVLSLYPKGVSITELRAQLSKRNVQLDKEFYGYRSFSKFLLSMPKILQVVPKGDGMFLVLACTQEMDNKASSKLSSENPKIASVEKMHEKVKQNFKDVQKESQSQDSSQESVKAKDEPVKENQVVLAASVDVSSSMEKEGVFKKVKRLLSGSPEMELEHLQANKLISGNGDEVNCIVSEEIVIDKDLEKSRIASSTYSDSAKVIKAVRPGLLSRILKSFKFFKGRNTEHFNAVATSMVSKSQFGEVDDEKKSKNIDIIQKPLERSRSEVIADCHKLIKKITKENPGGYNMSNFKKDFYEKFGHRLDYQNLGYSKLQSLIQIIPEARIESGYIVPSSTPAPYDSNKVQSGDERKKKKGDETKSDLLKILGSWDTVKDVKKTCAFDDDKLVDGILRSLRKKPSGESSIQR